jgi:RNA polymerase sigma-70 factor (ECF subfamily)
LLQPNPDETETVELEKLLDRCRSRLSRVLYRYRIPTQDAEDLLQETFLILVAKWDGIRSPDAWLVATLRNRCIIYWRRRRSRIYDLMDDAMLEVLAQGEPPGQEQAELRRDLSEALEGLAPHHRQILSLRYTYGCTSQEVGEQMGYGAGSVRKMTQRCLDRLTRDLHDAGFEAAGRES